MNPSHARGRLEENERDGFPLTAPRRHAILRHVARHILPPLLVFVALLLLVGCEEDDLSGAVGGDEVTATTRSTEELPVSTPLRVDLLSTNGALVVVGGVGLQTASITVTRRSRGSTLGEAQDRLDRMRVRILLEGDRLGVSYDADEQDADVRRVSGADFELRIPAESGIKARTSNGAIELTSVRGDVSLRTSNGAVDVRSVSGNVSIDTSNGEIRVERIHGAVIADTSNGSIRYAGLPSDGSAHRLHTSNGGIEVRIPGSGAIYVDAHTSSGTIQSSLPFRGDTEGRTWSANLNPPTEAGFHLRTSNGSIRIEPLP